jgi:hypothetical protein
MWRTCALTSHRPIRGDTEREILKRIAKTATELRGKLENRGRKTRAPSVAVRFDLLRWFSPLLLFMSSHMMINTYVMFTNRGDSFVVRPCNVPSVRIHVKLKANVVRCATLSDDAIRPYVMTGRLSHLEEIADVNRLNYVAHMVSCFICFICILNEKYEWRSSDFLLNKNKKRK